MCKASAPAITRKNRARLSPSFPKRWLISANQIGALLLALLATLGDLMNRVADISKLA